MLSVGAAAALLVLLLQMCHKCEHCSRPISRKTEASLTHNHSQHFSTMNSCKRVLGRVFLQVHCQLVMRAT